MKRRKSRSEEFGVFASFQASLSECEFSRSGNGKLSFFTGLKKVVAHLQDTQLREKKVLLVGNGGSAAIASHQSVDLWRNAGLRALSFNDGALLTCIANDFGYEEVFAKPIAMFAEPGDLVIAISSSGQSANILRAAEMALEMECRLVTFTGFQFDNPLRQLGTINVYLPSQSYGIVETGHLLLLHSIVDEFIRLNTLERRGVNDIRNSQSPVLSNVTHSPN